MKSSSKAVSVAVASAVAPVAVSIPAPVGIIPVGITDDTLVAMAPADLLQTADTYGNSMFNIVRYAALKAARDTRIEVDAEQAAKLALHTADGRAKYVAGVFSGTLSKLSDQNRSNISNWFRATLVVAFAPAAMPIAIAAGKKQSGPVVVPVEQVVTMSKNTLVDAAKQVRDSEGSGRAAGGGAKPAAPAAAPAPAAAKPITAEGALEVAFWNTLEKKLGTLEGFAALQNHLRPLGYTLVTYEEPTPEEPDADVQKAEAELKKTAKPKK